MRCPENPFQCGCICVEPHGISKPNVLVLIVANRVILFLYRIHKKIPSGLGPIYFRLLYETLLPISFPPMFDMGESLKER
jgi:hypothetical protein